MKNLNFKKGSYYTRKSIGEICFPGVGRPKGGDWDTGYVRVDNNLIIFMNIGVPGKTGHDFDNYFDHITNTIIWFGKPGAHSEQPTFKNLLNGTYTPHFFARWDTNNTQFLYLGIGSIINFKDSVNTNHGNTIRLTLSINEAKDILITEHPELKHAENVTNFKKNLSSSFVLEKHLEDYLCKNWHNTIFGKNYSIYKNGRQFQTDTGPLDILAKKNDNSEFMVLELKRDKASDVAVAQTLRYMNFVRKTLAINNEEVRGCIIATEEDKSLMNAIDEVSTIDFYRYNLSFSLNLIK